MKIPTAGRNGDYCSRPANQSVVECRKFDQSLDLPKGIHMRPSHKSLGDCIGRCVTVGE